jgi:two-component system response regulator LytT
MRILIVEDEPVHSRYLANLLKETGIKISNIRFQKTLTAAECHLLENPIDLLFLDLNLYGEDGFDLLRGLAGASFCTIVVSAYAERAIEAYDCGVLDFIAKPVSKERLMTSLNRYRNERRQIENRLKYFSIVSDGIVEAIALADVIYFEAAGKNLHIHLRDTRKTCRRKIADVERVLPSRFMRIHRSYIVDATTIARLTSAPGGRYAAHLRNGTELPVSRKLYANLRTLLLA